MQVVDKFLSFLKAEEASEKPTRYWRYIPEYLDQPFDEESMKKCHVARAKSETAASFIFYLYRKSQDIDEIREDLERIVEDLGLRKASDLGEFIVNSAQVVLGKNIDDKFCYSRKVSVPLGPSGSRKSSRITAEKIITEKVCLPIDEYFSL